MSEQRKLLGKIRAQAGTNGKQKPMVAKLPDEQLFFVYEHLQYGTSNRAIARSLIGQFGVRSTENSLAQSIAKLRSRISSLLVLPATTETLPPIPMNNPVSLNSLPVTDRLERLRDIEDAYAQLLQETIARCREQGVLVPDLHKHTQALATLSKTRARLEQAAPSRPTSVVNDKSFKERAQRVLDEFIGDDGDKMIQAGHRFIELIEKKIFQMWPDENGVFREIPPKIAQDRSPYDRSL